MNSLFFKKFSSFVKILPKKMKFISDINYKQTKILSIEERNLPEFDLEKECLVKVNTFALNRLDILQKNGKYPPPKGVTDILGLECSGYLVENESVNYEKKVMCLLPGGGYAEYVKVSKNHLMPLPINIDIVESAAIPEVWLTSFLLVNLAKIKEDDFCLVHAACSGIGTSMLQLINLKGGFSFSFCSTQEKIKFCEDLVKSNIKGLIRTDENRFDDIAKITNGKGCNAIFDCIGSSEFENNLNAAGMDCIWICYGLMGGNKVKEIDLAKLMKKRIEFIFSTLRNRSDEFKSELIKDFMKDIFPKFSTGEIRPIIDKVYNVNEVNDAHLRMEENKNIGKILVKWP